MTRKNILVCPLDWGIGHATRSTPIIRVLVEAEMNVIIAADGRPYALLEKEFPNLEMIRLPGYKVSYPQDAGMTAAMIRQIPQMMRGIVNEHNLLKSIINKRNIDLVISDGRFGLWSRQIPCVYLTHQLIVKFPKSLKSFEHVFYKWHCHVIKRYTECWIPDLSGEPNLSGDLSHKYTTPSNCYYIGTLSRFSTDTKQDNPSK
ncbi:MAG: glycosyltransferase, partial [Calditrichaeota bacterium]|nr:glycosyltransferase [Calditrichota bacterium]